MNNTFDQMNNTFDLWRLLKKYNVVVPVIQRDYAQGRKDKEYVRKSFLTDIKAYLDGPKQVTLDFVYGNVEGNRFYPLDGQQRLTTLWLIHWYISFKSGTLQNDKATLSKFTYETRTSSGKFCSALCEMATENITISIAEYIKAQTWFYSSWLQDPTICSMLRTISGDEGSSDDNIEAIFGHTEEGYSALREKLFNGNKVSFKLMVIGNEKLPISDDLYIKMNARGKGLSDFENFKADLVSWIQNSQNPDSSYYEQLALNDNRISYKHYYPAQIDNRWTDVFWNSAYEQLGDSFTGRIDEIYFSFINRFILNEICLDNSLSPAEFAPNKENESHHKQKSAFDKLFGTGLHGSSADDSLVQYEGFEIYKPYLTFQNMGRLDYIFEKISDKTILTEIEKSLNISDADADENTTAHKYSFVPYYLTPEVKLSFTSQKERVYFLAICLFLDSIQDHDVFDPLKYSKWMRVVRNLIENAAIDNVPAMVTCMRLIHKLAMRLNSYDNDIYRALNDYSDDFTNSQLEMQLKEEKEKAKQIINDGSYENKIREAENWSFFNGTIRFLYLNESSVQWDDFDLKFEHAKKLFNNNTVDITTITEFLKLFFSFEEIKDKYLFTSVGYHPRHKCWKKDILCSDNPEITKKVHALLTGSAESTHEHDYHEFLNSGLIRKIVEKSENYKYRYHWHYYWVIHKDYSSTEGVYVSPERKEKCLALKKLIDEKTIVLLNNDFNLYCNGYYWGICVSFEYDDSQYHWYSTYDNNSGKPIDRIYKYEDGKESKDAVIWETSSELISALKQYNNRG